MLRQHLLRRDLDGGLRLSNRDILPQPSGELERSVVALGHGTSRRHGIDRHPEVGDETGWPRAAEATRHHAHDLDLLAPEQDRLADNGRIARKTQAPRALAENHDVGSRIVGRVDPAELRRHTQHRQIVGRRGFAHHPRRQLTYGQRQRGIRARRQIREDVAALGEVQIVGPGGQALAGVDADDLLRPGHRQLFERQRIDDAEDGGVAADGEGERQDRDHREGGTAADEPGSELRILPQFAAEPGDGFLSLHSRSPRCTGRRAAPAVAEFPQRLFARRRLRQAARHQVVDAAVDVKRELFLDIAPHVVATARRESEETFAVRRSNALRHVA